MVRQCGTWKVVCNIDKQKGGWGSPPCMGEGRSTARERPSTPSCLTLELVGSLVSASVGAVVGTAVGAVVGASVADAAGDAVGDSDGNSQAPA